MTDYTPIERGAEAIAGEYDRRNRYKPGTWWGALHRRANLRMEARAVFESIDREGLIDVLVMSPLSDFVGTDMRPIERTADAILAHLLGTDEGAVMTERIDLSDYNKFDWENCAACLAVANRPCPYHQGRIDESNVTVMLSADRARNLHDDAPAHDPTNPYRKETPND